jgi:hypothetical protein
MAARADQVTAFGTPVTYKVTSGQTVAANVPLKFAGADHEVQQAQSGDLICGISLQAGNAGDLIQVMLPGPVVPVKVGTGGATRGKFAIEAAANDGLTDQLMGGGTVVRYSPGFFTQSGSAGDLVGLCMTLFAGGSA